DLVLYCTGLKSLTKNTPKVRQKKSNFWGAVHRRVVIIIRGTVNFDGVKVFFCFKPLI
ncbi:hypothetical protein SMU21_01839, partial [Streptococcus mutans 1SM1]